MRCPQCGAATEVKAKRGPYRDRRCMNLACYLDFTTCENVMEQKEHHRLRAKTLALRHGPEPNSIHLPVQNTQLVAKPSCI
jgi:hypothetical protein